MSSIKSRLESNFIWFILGLIVAVIIGTIATVTWLEKFVDKRIYEIGSKIAINNLDDEEINQLIKSVEPILEKNGYVPSGVVAFFNSAECPKQGWKNADNVRGRYIVGLNAPGTIGAKVGAALQDKENRATGQHTHPYVDTTIAHGKGGWLAGGGSSNNWENSKSTGEASGASEEGTNAPYVQLLACEKL